MPFQLNSGNKLRGVVLGGALVLLTNGALAQGESVAPGTANSSAANTLSTPATDVALPYAAPAEDMTSPPTPVSPESAQVPRTGTTNGNINIELNARTTARLAQATRNSGRARAVSTPAARQVRPVSRARQAQAWRLVERGQRAMTAKNYSAALSSYQQAVQADPNNVYALGGVADNLLILGRFAQAESAYRRALARTPGNVRLLHGLGDALVPQRKYTAAIATYKQIANQQPRDFKAMYQLAQLLTWSQRYDEAEPYYRRALSLQPRNAEAWTAWGESLSFNRDSRARETFERALELRPNDARALVGVGNVYGWNGDYTSAANYNRRALAVAPRNAAALVGLGDALTFSARPTEAIPLYQRALLSEPANLQARLGLGRALVQAQRHQEAIPYLRQVLAREPGNNDALQLLATAQAGPNSSASLTAVATLNQLLARQTSPEEKAETLIQIAQLHQRAGDFAKARAAYTQAIALTPADAETRLAYAQALIGEGEWEEARRVVDDALRRQPSNTRALIMQVAIESRIGTPERAAALANRLLALNVTEPQDALVLANALRTAGNNEGAQRVLERLALQADVSNPAVALEIATAVRDAGLYEAAEPIFEKILAANPQNVEARVRFAEMLLWQNQYDAAQSHVNLLLKNEPNNTQARVLAATIALRRDETTGAVVAEREAEAILAEQPRNAAAGILLGQVQSLRQRYADAVATYQKAVDAEPNNLEARIGLARNLYYARQTAESIEQYRELIKRAPGDATIKLELAKIYLDQNQLSDAETLYAEVLATNSALLPPVARRKDGVQVKALARISPSLKPLRGEPFFKPARIVKTSAQSKPRVRLAQAVADDAVAPATTPGISPEMTTSTAPNTTSATATPGTTTGEAADPVPYIAPGDLLETTPAPLTPAPMTPGAVIIETPATGAATINASPATVTIDATLEEQVLAAVGLGEVRRRQGRFEEAIDYFNRALQIDSSNVAARVGLAQSLRGKGDYLRALQEVERVLATDETNLNARVLRAQLLADTGEKARAQTELDALVAGLPDQPTLETYLDLSSAFTELQNYEAAMQLLTAAQQDFPDRVEVQTRVAETLTFAQRWDEALAAWDKLIALDPQDTTAVLGRARVFNYSNRLVDAEAGYRRALELEPNNYTALTELADILARQSEYPDAIALYRQAIAQNPGDLRTRTELARVLRYNRNFTEAEEVATNVIEVDARYAPAYTERSLARSSLGNYEAAIADARQALAITPNDVTAQLGLAEVLSYTGQYDESIRLYRAALERDPNNEKARTELAAALAYAGQYDAALAEANTVLAANPQNLDAQIIKADTFARARRTSEAVALYRSILQQDSRNLRARVGLAEAYAYNLQYDEAIRIYDELIALDPANPAYHIAKGRTLGYARRYPQAIAVLRPIVAQNPTNTQARLALAEVMTNSGNADLRSEAVAQYQLVLRENPDNVDARIGLGRVYSYSGQYAQAETTFNEILRRYPDNTEARYALAESQRFAGDLFDARENYQRVLQREPQNIGAQTGLATVRRATAPSVTAAVTHYSDTNDVRVRSYSLGAQLPTRAGTIGLTGETGTFEDDGVELRRRALTLLLAKNFGALQARLLLSRVDYNDAPDKTLYDLNLSRSYTERKRVYVTVAKRDIIESIEAVQDGITAQVYEVGGAYPLGNRFDLEMALTHYRYSDDNSRTAISPSLYYRFRPTNPSLRIGLGYRYDDTRETGRPYYTPQSFSSLVALADYVKTTGRLQYGVFASVPIAESSDDTDGDDEFDSRPANTLFGFVTYELTDLVDLFLNGGVVRGPTFDSNQITAGATVRF